MKTLRILLFTAMFLALFAAEKPCLAGGGSSVGTGTPVGFTQEEALQLFRIFVAARFPVNSSVDDMEYSAEAVCSASSVAFYPVDCLLNSAKAVPMRLDPKSAGTLFAILSKYRTPIESDKAGIVNLEVKLLSCTRESDSLEANPVCFAY